ncbi:MAG: V-type ATP synthase subunit A [Defluviitaleaceae bacterium]|nr:V-type ATP synthase subunit A [Defluviitaleaceae bacterium]
MSEIIGINGPVITVSGGSDFCMAETVKVGASELEGEVISLRGGCATVQVYESTSGLKPGDAVRGTGVPLSVCLAPGMAGNVFDGIGRPLKSCGGIYIEAGAKKTASGASEKKWSVNFCVAPSETVFEGQTIAETVETPSVVYKVTVPPGTGGSVLSVSGNGLYSTDDVLALISTPSGVKEIKLAQHWPVRTPRPCKERYAPDRPLVTGQRIIDMLFPIAKGGTAAIPGGFGTGKTMTQHQLAKWADADIIVYIGCGERGNEMAEVLEEFGGLIDPRTGSPLMDRTILIANTSNMPVAAREASIYTGITIAEFYRDMGYHVALMADSTSRWAEALRELSGRLEEIPAEEGYPAYLASRLSGFYERAGYVKNLNGTDGSVTIIGAVSPQGADFSEPVTQNTKRFVRCFWALDRTLAYARHYPAINWIESYSEYTEELKPWYKANAGTDFMKNRAKIIKILCEENEILEIAKLIGADILPDEKQLTLEVARVIRIGFAQQNARHETDAYTPLAKQVKMLELIIYLDETCKKILAKGAHVDALRRSGIFDEIIGLKYEKQNGSDDGLKKYYEKIDLVFDGIVNKTENRYGV